MEERKIAEKEYADFRQTLDPASEEGKKYLSNMKYYSVVRKTTDYIEAWIDKNCDGKDVFEMACGNGGYSLLISKKAKSLVAADISPLSIQQAAMRAKEVQSTAKIQFQVLDCENTGFPDNSFDVVFEGGALHHMDIHAAYKEAARLLRPGGTFVCIEALKHNPFIQLYRKMTPHLRTKWEADHILGRREIMAGKVLFEDIDLHFFHYLSMAAVPFRNTFLFRPVLSSLEMVDSVLAKIPGVRWMAWQSIFTLKNPRKDLLKK